MTTTALARLRKATDGAAAMEFALVAPLLITMMLGVVQAGMWMGAYNSLRSSASDTGRYVTVQYQNTNRISNSDIAIWARNHAITAPYSLDSSGVTTYVSDAATQSITNVTEKQLKIVYQMPTIMQFAGVNTFQISYTRSLFVKSGV
ncbi:MAG: pilus assembly protein [Sphingomonadales bacterium]|nr:pilus assembly protein [Sphingomonadales bacterium]